MKKYFLLIFIFLFSVVIFSQTKRAITIEDLWKLGRISQPALSPDGNQVAYTVTYYDMELNKGNSDIYILNLLSNEIKQITSSPKSDNTPAWFPDSKSISYISTKDGLAQIYSLNIENPMDEKRLTNISTGVSGIVTSKDGKSILFVSEVYPDCLDDNCNKTKDEEKEKNKVKARIIDELLYRKWDSWRDGKVSHLFVLNVESGEIKDMMKGLKNDCPPIDLGGKIDYGFSPDGKEICFVMNTDKVVATSTNNDIYLIETEFKNMRKISQGKGNDNQPAFSPDGRYISFKQMKRPGFEADKMTLMLYDKTTAKITGLTENLDRSIDEYVWSNDGKFIYITFDDMGKKNISRINLEDKKIEEIYSKHWNTELNLSADGKFLIFSQNSISKPADIYKFDLEKKELTQLTKLNENIMSEIELSALEDFWCIGAEGKRVQTLMLKPPFFNSEKKYPMIFLVHGGPQGAWEDNWHYRWNGQLYASPGYVVLMPNPRGSTGYGQKFTDEISGDWGGKPYEDLMNVFDYAVRNFKFIDGTKAGASGASYGGYMMNWMATKTDRFKAIVSHASVFNLESMFGTTEELWFPEWENKGTPWKNRELYRKFSPHNFVQNIKTPFLVTHGSNDFRVPEGQAMELFTSLQRLGVPSKFILFPDETHFVSKPQNFRLWMTEIFKWFNFWFNKNK